MKEFASLLAVVRSKALTRRWSDPKGGQPANPNGVLTAAKRVAILLALQRVAIVLLRLQFCGVDAEMYVPGSSNPLYLQAIYLFASALM